MALAGCGSACPTVSCEADLRLRGNVSLEAATTSLDVEFCFNTSCQDVTLDLENQTCASLDLSADSVVCASAPADGATTVSVSVVLANSAVHDGDRYAVTVSDPSSGDVLANQSGTFSYFEASSGDSACDLPTCKSATVSF
jgi:hypothetical protein